MDFGYPCNVNVSIPVFREALHVCPYLSDQQCSNLRFTLAQAEPSFMTLLLERGFRHFGDDFFRPECPECSRCVGIRVLAQEFTLNESRRRCLKKNLDLTLGIGPVVVDEERLDLLNRFQVARWIKKEWSLIEYSEEQYRSSFGWDPAVTQELTVRDAHGTLLAVGLIDVAQDSISAIYHFHDPAEHKRGLGNWLILKEIELLQKLNLPYLYMGLWNGSSPSLTYKKLYSPHEMLREGRVWERES